MNIPNNNEPSPVVEKVSLKDVKTEKNKQNFETNPILNDLFNSMLALNEEELKQAIAYVQSRLDILNKYK